MVIILQQWEEMGVKKLYTTMSSNKVEKKNMSNYTKINSNFFFDTPLLAAG